MYLFLKGDTADEDDQGEVGASAAELLARGLVVPLGVETVKVAAGVPKGHLLRPAEPVLLALRIVNLRRKEEEGGGRRKEEEEGGRRRGTGDRAERRRRKKEREGGGRRKKERERGQGGEGEEMRYV
jgi:hypothetical protein